MYTYNPPKEQYQSVVTGRVAGGRQAKAAGKKQRKSKAGGQQHHAPYAFPTGDVGSAITNLTEQQMKLMMSPNSPAPGPTSSSAAQAAANEAKALMELGTGADGMPNQVRRSVSRRASQ